MSYIKSVLTSNCVDQLFGEGTYSEPLYREKFFVGENNFLKFLEKIGSDLGIDRD